MDMEQIVALFSLAFAGLMFAALWNIFVKAGEAGWKALVPVYNVVVFLRMVGRPWWWLLMLCIPFVNAFFFIALCIELARAFGKGGVYAAGLMLITPVYLLVLAFGDAQYHLGRPKKLSAELARLYPERAA